MMEVIEIVGKMSQIHWRYILKSLSKVLMLLSVSMLPCVVIDCYDHHDNYLVYLKLSSIIFTIGCIGWLYCLFSNENKKIKNPSKSDGILSTNIAWLTFAAIAGLPFVFGKTHLSFFGGFFHAMSGLTTTGASAIKDLTICSNGDFIWCALLSIIGAIGIVGLTMEKNINFPQIVNIPKQVIKMYLILIFIGTLALKYAGGMGWINAFSYSASCIATCGFGNDNNSFVDYNDTCKWIAIILMLAGVLNFIFIYNVALKKLKIFPKLILSSHSEQQKISELDSILEVKFFFKLLLFAIVGSIAVLHFTHPLLRCIDIIFTIVSCITTTGLTVVPIDLQYIGCLKSIGVVLAFCGGCSCSTAGGLKISRLAAVLKKIDNQFIYKYIPQVPKKEYFMKAGAGRTELVQSTLVFTVLYFATILIFYIMLDTSIEHSTLENLFSLISNTGISVGGVNFYKIPNFAYFLGALVMLLGRLEIFPFYSMKYPSFWKIHESKKKGYLKAKEFKWLPHLNSFFYF